MGARVVLVWLLLLAVLVASARASLPHGGKIWALLVAGSKEYYNYRHQADVCHAYQILHENGIPDENIIVMMYDDIAHAKENPTPGLLINEPEGSDVYQGVPKDYTGEAVNASVFLAVLRGDKSAVQGIGTGRVIESGPHDHVFINFVDHGAPGLLAMPSDIVYASQLLETLLAMNAQSKFAKLVLYVEACESGSMFDSLLPDDMDILAVTAADPHESSYACYFDDSRQAYLGDLFSVMWMQDTEQDDLSRATLHHQFEKVRSRTNMSHVEEYGDLGVGSLMLKDFIGSRSESSHLLGAAQLRKPPNREDVVSSRDVPLHVLRHRIASESNKKKQIHLKYTLRRLKKRRAELERLFRAVVGLVAGAEQAEDVMSQRKPLRNLACYEQAVKEMHTRCVNIVTSPHALSQLYLLVNLCEGGFSAESIEHAIRVQCTEPTNRRYTSVV